MPLFIDQLSLVCRVVKPHAVSLLADIAMALEGPICFDRYVSTIMPILAQAGGISISEGSDEDEIEYINTLRESIMEAYTGIVQGLTGANKQDVIFPYVEGMASFIGQCTNDPYCNESVSKAAVGLVGDLGSSFGSKLRHIYSVPYFMQFLQRMASTHPEWSSLTSWAIDVCDFYNSFCCSYAHVQHVNKFILSSGC